jgi:peptide/nickel transport system permease protein
MEAARTPTPDLSTVPLRTDLGVISLRAVISRPLGALGLFMVLLVVVIALTAPLTTRYGPNDQDYTVRLQAPSLSHLMGTDEFGRDLWARIAYGSRISLQVSILAVLAGTTFGLALGTVSGYFGGVVDSLLQRLVEVMMSLPGILLALALVAILGSGVDKVIIALSIMYLPWTLRIIRASVLSVRRNIYIDAAQSIGAGPIRIMVRHVVPNITAPYLILASSLLGNAILTEASLSFLGLGVPPPVPSWGRMLADSVAQYARSAPWMVVFPGMAITWLVLGFNLVGDVLRDAWDPRLRKG